MQREAFCYSKSLKRGWNRAFAPVEVPQYAPEVLTREASLRAIEECDIDRLCCMGADDMENGQKEESCTRVSKIKQEPTEILPPRRQESTTGLHRVVDDDDGDFLSLESADLCNLMKASSLQDKPQPLSF